MSLPGVYKTFAQKWDGQTVWIYSEPHFSDVDLKYGIADRPSDEEQIKNINSMCGRKDTLIILGDIGNIECVRQLRARYKVLIMGNHDSGVTNYERRVEERVFDRDIYPDKSEVYSIMKKEFPGWNIHVEENYDFHPPFKRWIAYADNKLFDEVYEGPLIIGEKLILSHEPLNLSWMFNIHGHNHIRQKNVHNNCLNVCSDVVNYKPINLTQKLKQGLMSSVTSIHRKTINNAKMKNGYYFFKLNK